MTGGGFGGCAVALVEHRAASDFAKNVARLYEVETQLKPSVYICKATNGAELVEG
jgi:galactokinase